MAAGRGEFFRSLWESLKGLPTQPPPLRRLPGRGRGSPGPGFSYQGHAGRYKTKGRPKLPRGLATRSVGRRLEDRKETEESSFPKIKASSCEENRVERLPAEILIKILSFLDPSSLFSISHVSRLFHQLASNNVIWRRIYTSEFGISTWKPKLGDAVVKEQEDWSAGHWRNMYFRAVTGQEMDKWRRELKHISPYTGLPKQTGQFLRKQNVRWHLKVCDSRGREQTLEQSCVYFLESSVIVRWSEVHFLNYYHISNIQLHGFRKERAKSLRAKKPHWRSLILNLDVKPHLGRVMGKDRLITMMHLQPGFIIGVWRGQNRVAFIMVSLHFHKLVEKSLLGSLVFPFSEAESCRPVDNLHPDIGLCGYSLHIVLHNTSTEMMSRYFRDLSCHTAQIQRGKAKLRVIERTNLSQHRCLSGNLKLPWMSEELEGSVENCCVMTLTLLDDCHKPCWCVSSPVSMTPAKKPLSSNYSGEHYLMQYHHPEGEVTMTLVWLEEQKQFFLVGLTVYISVTEHRRRAEPRGGSPA